MDQIVISTVAQPKGENLEVVYTWPDGREEVRYRRTSKSKEAAELIAEVDALQKAHGIKSPYSYRYT